MSAIPPRPHVLITGAAGGIGAALAREFLGACTGCSLTLTDIDAEGLEVLSMELGGGGRVATSRWDLSQPDSLEAGVQEATARFGPVDVLVNCAGIMEIRSLAGTPWALGQRLLDIDLISPMRLMSLLVPSMVERGRGVVINVSSMAGVTPIRGCTYYGAAKAGLAMGSEIAHLELAPHGVHVVTVYPGPVASNLEQRARGQVPQTLIARLIPTGQPDVLAEMILSACAARRRRVVYPPLYRAARKARGVSSRFTAWFSPVPLQ